MASIIGWDVGGAHLKAARVEDRRLVATVQLASPLWLGLDRLREAIAGALDRLGPAERHVATMTGELCDIFPDRAHGAAKIAEMLATAVGEPALLIYGGRAGMLAPSRVGGRADDVASANWHASAALAARFVPDELFIDVGSTTADLIPIAAGRVAAAGYTDAERLASGELVYTGLTRTPLMALARRAPVAGAWAQVAAEYFATTADIYRILGELPEHADQMPAADGREKTIAASCARLARMVGCDAAGKDWAALAAWFAEAQLRLLLDGAMLVLSRVNLLPDAPVIAAGAGWHIAARLAARLGRRCERFATIAALDACDGADQCAPAAAVALLLGYADAAA